MEGNNKGQNQGTQDQNTQNQNNSGIQQPKEIQYTQTELDMLLAQKRVAAKNEFLKSIGFDGDEEGLKNTLARVMEEDKKNQTELQKAQNDLIKLQKELRKEQETRKLLETKLEAIKLGARSEYVDDLVILASAKLPENGELSTVISEIKKTYPVYFADENNGQDGEGEGTKGHIGKKDMQNNGNSNRGDSGSKGRNNDDQGNAGDKSIAERLFSRRKQFGKSSYFSNK